MVLFPEKQLNHAQRNICQKTSRMTIHKYPRQESNLYYRLRRPVRYPLHHGGILTSVPSAKIAAANTKSNNRFSAIVPGRAGPQFRAGFLIEFGRSRAILVNSHT